MEEYVSKTMKVMEKWKIKTHKDKNETLMFGIEKRAECCSAGQVQKLAKGTKLLESRSNCRGKLKVGWCTSGFQQDLGVSAR